MNPNDIVKFRSDFTVELYHLEGSDGRIRRIAKVSTNGDIELPKDDSPEVLRKFLSFLMRNQHGSPFEHNLLTFRIEAPIFLWREFHRHRIGFSCNEQSGRYMQLLPHFYVPSDERRLHSNKPAGFKPSSPSYTQLLPTPPEDWETWRQHLSTLYQQSYTLYQYALSLGLDNGLARIVLPVGLYSACYVTCNVRSLINFLNLRLESDHSHPQWEMDQLAKMLEHNLAAHFPITHSVWVEHGRGKL